ncbi:leishmanolysin-related zinc metalloendopeptidase [Marinobacterium stanieri]|uniref:Leishmanolysin n=1 Tax=Marinobacterium stanieri TaxID=49186 RepID=A0A1N6SAA1_9GAMM|nr:leishmanolysin-related zinc metalloendopeptidase [Marinobacterium stanieri]SIQ37967.1 Leishmanolysin [Marinobacterium stanieri]
MNSKKLLNSEFGLSHQGGGLSQQLDDQTWLFDSFLDAKGGEKGRPSDNNIDPGTTNPEVTDVYISGDPGVDDSEEFNIHLDFYGDLWTDALKEDFIAAADFLSDLITADIAPDGDDDITIDASLIDIDGPGGVLGRAGPTTAWNESDLSATAIMEFDVADAEVFDGYGLWNDIVLHEMIHSLGLGTLWEYQGLLTTQVDDNGTKKPVDDTISYVYNGAQANYYSGLLYNEPVAVIEDEGGSGTAGGHWDEDTYFNELMTGYINSLNELSEMSYGALEDLGYQIDYTVTPDFLLG